MILLGGTTGVDPKTIFIIIIIMIVNNYTTPATDELA